MNHGIFAKPASRSMELTFTLVELSARVQVLLAGGDICRPGAEAMDGLFVTFIREDFTRTQTTDVFRCCLCRVLTTLNYTSFGCWLRIIGFRDRWCFPLRFYVVRIYLYVSTHVAPYVFMY